jgi:hypothetical protein
VEAVDLALRRRGLRYQWIWISESPEQAFRDGTIDIFPDLTDLPSRRKQNIHFSAPWLQNDYSLLSLKSSGILKAADTGGRQVVYKGSVILESVAERYLPGIRPLRKTQSVQALQSLCAGEATAALVEYRTMKSMLLQRPAGCEQAAFNFIPLTTMVNVSVGSTMEAANAADALRDELGMIAREEKLSPIIARWSFDTDSETRALFAIIDSQARSWRLFYTVLALAGALGFTLWHMRLTGRRESSGRQGGVSGQHEPRNPHTHEWHHRTDEPGPGHQPFGRAAREFGNRPNLRRVPPFDPERHSGFFQDRGGPPGSEPDPFFSSSMPRRRYQYSARAFSTKGS